MALIGRLHPILIHFPIALVIVAVAAEGLAALTQDARWRAMAVGNIRVAAGFALVAAVAGWRLAVGLNIDPTPLLAWHRWLGTAGAGVTLAAAVATWKVERRSVLESWAYPIALASAAVLVGVAGHLGGLLVWGADFLRP